MTRWSVGVIITLSLVFLAPLAAEAQPSAKVARIGYLSPGGGAGSPPAEALRQGLRELGYVEGHNIALEFRAAGGKSDLLPTLATELVQLPVDVIVVLSSAAAQMAKHATTTIPIVMVSSGDPVATGLVASLAHPSGNLTGLTGLATELSGKRLELLREAVPSLARVAVQPLGVREGKDIDSAIAAMTAERPDAIRRQRTGSRGGTHQLWTERHGSAPALLFQATEVIR